MVRQAREETGQMRLFNEPAGREFLAGEGAPQSLIDQLPLLGISGICNVIAAINMNIGTDASTNSVMKL